MPPPGERQGGNLMSRALAVKKRVRLNADRLAAALTLLPSIIAVGLFVYGFIAWNTFISFTKWKGVIPNYVLVGLKNYIRLFQDERFQIGLRNMLVFSLVFIAGCMVIGLLLAILLDRQVKGEAFFRNVYLLPMAVSLVVTGVVWRWLLTPGSKETGYVGVNQLFDSIGLGFLKSGWYTDPRIGIIAVGIAAIWQMSGYVMAMYLAGLRCIPEEVREAARMDAASELQMYRYVIIPMLRDVSLSIVLVLGHISLKVFDLVSAMTGPGIGFSTDVPAYFMWDTTFRANRFNQGAAIGTILLVMVAFLIVPYMISNMRSEG